MRETVEKQKLLPEQKQEEKGLLGWRLCGASLEGLVILAIFRRHPFEKNHLFQKAERICASVHREVFGNQEFDSAKLSE